MPSRRLRCIILKKLCLGEKFVISDVLRAMLPGAVLLAAELVFIGLRLRRKNSYRPVSAAVRRVENDDSSPEGTAVTVVYAFNWEGRACEVPVKLQQGCLPPPEGERREMLYSPELGRLRTAGGARSSPLRRAVVASWWLLLPALLMAAAALGALGVVNGRTAAYIAAACWALPFIIYIFLPRRRAEGIGEQKMPVEPVLATYLGEYEYDTSDGAGRWQMFACHWQGSDYRMPVSSKRRGLVPGQQLTLYRDRRSGMVGDVGDMIEKAGERRGL